MNLNNFFKKLTFGNYFHFFSPFVISLLYWYFLGGNERPLTTTIFYGFMCSVIFYIILIMPKSDTMKTGRSFKTKYGKVDELKEVNYPGIETTKISKILFLIHLIILITLGYFIFGS